MINFQAIGFFKAFFQTPPGKSGGIQDQQKITCNPLTVDFESLFLRNSYIFIRNCSVLDEFFRMDYRLIFFHLILDVLEVLFINNTYSLSTIFRGLNQEAKI